MGEKNHYCLLLPPLSPKSYFVVVDFFFSFLQFRSPAAHSLHHVTFDAYFCLLPPPFFPAAERDGRRDRGIPPPPSLPPLNGAASSSQPPKHWDRYQRQFCGSLHSFPLFFRERQFPLLPPQQQHPSDWQEEREREWNPFGLIPTADGGGRGDFRLVTSKQEGATHTKYVRTQPSMVTATLVTTTTLSLSPSTQSRKKFPSSTAALSSLSSPHCLNPPFSSSSLFFRHLCKPGRNRDISDDSKAPDGSTKHTDRSMLLLAVVERKK